MDGIKLARINRCHTCPHRHTRHETVWAWPHCDWRGGDLELDDGFMEGPDANCPSGFWQGLEPVDMEAERKEAEEAALEVERERCKPLLTLALAKITGPEVQGDFLVEAVAGGMVSQVVAKEAAQEEGLDLDAESAPAVG